MQNPFNKQATGNYHQVRETARITETGRTKLHVCTNYKSTSAAKPVYTTTTNQDRAAERRTFVLKMFRDMGIQ